MLKQNSFVYPIPFIGRAKELAEVTARLVDPDCRLLTLTGLGGSGKTRLAIAAAAAVAPQFPQGTVFVPLQPLPRSDLLVPTIAQAVGMSFYRDGDLYQQLLDYLHEKTLVLILDNFEHVLDGAAVVSAILASAPGVTIVITSREALNLREEWRYPLHGMAMPPSVDSTSLEDYDAVQLFLSHARRVQPQFDLTHDPVSVFRICTMTAGLPLAIELAAAWLKGLRAAHIAQEMQHNLDFLSATTRNGEERHRSMRAVFDQSWSFLSENERRIFARLSVFPGSFAGEAAEQVAGASFASLASLVEQSLLQIESTDHFGIHELLRQYGREHLDAYGETAATCARHSQYFAQLMLRHETALQQLQQLDTLQAIERDFANIRLAWEWSSMHQHVTQLHTMLHGLYLFGFLGSRYREIITLFQACLDQGVADAPLLGRLLAQHWGYLHWLHQADDQEAHAQIAQALAIARAADNRFEIAFGQLMAAYALITMDRDAEAVPHLERSQALFAALNEPYYVSWTLHRLGFVHSSLNNRALATTYTEQSLAFARSSHNRVALVICLYNLGSFAILESDYVNGQQYCAEALQIATEAGHQDQIAHAFSLLALCAFCQGDYTTCRDYTERSQAILEAINALHFEPYNLALLILLACLREEYAEGVHLTGSRNYHSNNKMGIQLYAWALAALACGLGAPLAVREHIQNVLDVSAPEVNAITTIWIIPCVAYAIAETDPERAVELVAWVVAYPDTALDWARHWPLFERLRAQLHAKVDGDSYQMHWKKGQACTRDSITTYLHQAFRAPADAGAVRTHDQLLTARESEILGLMAAGMTNPQIAAQLVIGAGTVKTHTLHIYRKLEVANRMQAIVRARELGVLPA